ncbi:MAG TPA: sulfatase-like hydrolase/transferase [Thermoanaerobaculia bacterium]
MLLALLLAACTRPAEKPVDTHVTPNAPVILISIDTLRADHLPAYGYKGIATPALDGFRRDAILYRNAYAHCPMTLPSHVSMLTGLLPPEHGVRDNAGFRFDGTKHATLPELLKQRGYATGAAVSSFVLRGETGLGPLFEAYDDAIDPPPGAAFREYARDGNVTEQLAEQWLAQHAAKPFFYFFHIYEPHVPYDSGSYDGDIVAADAIVGKLLAFLKAKQLYDGALIVITSDHGEGLGDHGEEQHSILVYREAIHVPLLVKLPKNAQANTTNDASAALADIFPTVLEVTGADAPPRANAVSLLALPPSRAIYAESLYPLYHFGWSELRTVVDERWQFIEAPRPELYDVIADPREKRDVATTERRTVAAMRQQLAKHADAAPPVGDIDPEDAAKLAALGYVGSAKTPAGGPRPNPNTEIAQLEALRRGIDLTARRRYDEAVNVFRTLIAGAPEMVEAWSRMGEALAAAGQLDEAANAYREANARSQVASSELALDLADVYLRQRKAAEAEAIARASLAAAPRRARALLARTALARRDVRTAVQEAQALVVVDPRPSDFVLLAEMQLASGDAGAALATLGQVKSPVYRLEFVRADALARSGNIEGAVAAYRREIEQFPRNIRAYANLAVLQFVSGDRRAYEETLRAMIAANPTAEARELARTTREMLAAGN